MTPGPFDRVHVTSTGGGGGGPIASPSAELDTVLRATARRMR